MAIKAGVVDIEVSLISSLLMSLSVVSCNSLKTFYV